jgi:hypothetical protein
LVFKIKKIAESQFDKAEHKAQLFSGLFHLAAPAQSTPRPGFLIGAVVLALSAAYLK